MRTPLFSILVLSSIILAIGCGQIPLISENRVNFPPWEKLPEGNGIAYVEKFTRDPGHDPLYLAKIKYEDAGALKRVVDAFGLVLHPTLDSPDSFVSTIESVPPWYPLTNVTQLYIFPPGQHRYAANLWVNTHDQTMILERVWY